MELGEAMHLKSKGVLGIAVPVLLGGALAAGALALPAHAQSYSDTSLSATAVTDDTFDGGTLGVSPDGNDLTLTATGSVTWSEHGSWPSGVSLSSSTISYTGGIQTGPITIVADAKDSAGNAKALVIQVSMGVNSIALDTTFSTVSIVASSLADTNAAGAVTFSATSSATNDTLTFSESNLPVGLVSGNPTLTYVNGTATPGTYTGVVATVTDTDGAVLNGTFTLTVNGNEVTSTSTSTGDEVNQFGYGFDSYRQHDYAGARIVGWNASSSDPATQFLENNGSHSGYIQFEYAPSGSGSGLCVSDPGGGWGSDPLRDGLILTNCNSGPFQQFLQQSDGTLVNLATGLTVNPAGKGGQLRGGSSAVSWGGSSYTWEAGE
jgi:hypothetical protein